MIITSLYLTRNRNPHLCQTGKSTTIRRTAVQEPCVSRHHGEPIEGSPKTHRASHFYLWYRGVHGGPSIFPYYAESFSDSWCRFFRILYICKYIYLYIYIRIVLFCTLCTHGIKSIAITQPTRLHTEKYIWNLIKWFGTKRTLSTWFQINQ